MPVLPPGIPVFPSSLQMKDVADWDLINYGEDFILHNGFQEGNARSMYHAGQENRDIVYL